jgi:hypothetical protein
MDHRLVSARHVRGHVVRLCFADGAQGDVDLSDDLDGPIFESLRDVGTFAQFRVDPVFRTLVWPNGADLAPEYLRGKLVRAIGPLVG